jgi:hypothetical protein
MGFLVEQKSGMSIGRIRFYHPTRQYQIEAGEERHTMRDLELYPRPADPSLLTRRYTPKTYIKLTDAVVVLANLNVDEKLVTCAAIHHWMKTEVDQPDHGGLVEILDAVTQRYGHRPMPLAFVEALLALHATGDNSTLYRYLEGLANGLGF